MEYKLIKTNRKTMAIQIAQDGGVIVRAPLNAKQMDIDAFVERSRQWIEKNSAKMLEINRSRAEVVPITPDEIRRLTEEAKQVIPERVKYYAHRIGVTYGKVTIRHQHRKWGSCSSKGNLNFNCLLMLAPPEVLDSVVVHELCHRKQMNHSKLFYAEVLKAFPDYYRWHAWLTKNGPELVRRMTAGEDM